MFVEATDYITRQVFSIAHEIGHFILHNDGTSHTSKRDTSSSLGLDEKEIEANTFAANLFNAAR
ncbi:ImmA/IrrE family metallo-endopeptidase [Helicobacter cinaedi]|uniref:ImmA/IrrE family metallo-endopeptidase n=1 Tax=Helicobacter cinaedi TaxID=213 RepID=UPI000E207C5A